MHLLSSLLLLGIGALALVRALPTNLVPQTSVGNNSLPLVIWHGLGDSYSSPGIVQFMSFIRDIHPGLYIHSIYVDEDNEKDQKATWFGNVDEQLVSVAEQLAAIPELQKGFDAFGFSQGGQFLRGYIERYNNPPVRNLVTFGSQHMGISELPGCKPFDVICRLARSAAGLGVYTDWAQKNIIPAQYYRDTTQLSVYLASNHFLTDINNEHLGSRNKTYAQNFSKLSNLVLVLFTQDKTVVPKESAWFGSYTPLQEDSLASRSEPTLVPMRLQPLYTEDWIGLKQLDLAGRVQLKSCEGEHMQLARKCWEPLVRQYVGSGGSQGSASRPGLLNQGS